MLDVSRASCRDVSSELFFCDHAVKNFNLHDRVIERAKCPTCQRAKLICADCPIKQACLEMELDFESQWGQQSPRYGIYGGLDPDERGSVLRRRRELAQGALFEEVV